MKVYFSTVNRSAPIARGGELVSLDWGEKRVLATTPIAPENPTLDDPNPRGNTRGGRGITLLQDGDVLVCSYHTLRIFDRDLKPRRDFTHPLMVSLHENALAEDGTLWTTSTAVDAALRIDLSTGELIDARWPREQPGLSAALELTPLELDKNADNRARFLGSEHFQHPHHVHLNAVALWRGELLGLFSKHGVIANLDRDRILVEDKILRGAHNLLVEEDGTAYVSHSLGHAVLRFDLERGERTEKLAFGRSPVVRDLVRWHEFAYRLKRRLERLKLLPATPPRPLFVRGLTRVGDTFLVGVSPATILQLDAGTGAVLDSYTYSNDVRSCVHGLAATEG